jgi:ABC-2 type transport system ATP-binding protein
MIVVDGVTKSFPSHVRLLRRIRRGWRVPNVRVLDDVSFSVARAELVGLLGANGAGKTTVLHILATLAYPDRGNVTINGVSARAEPDRVRRMIGFCGSADRGFYYRLSVRENLRFFGALAGLYGADCDRRIAEVLELVDLTASTQTRYAYLSTGMRQRLAVARALLADPEVLLLDEPTRALDPVHADALRKLVRTRLVAELGKTVVLATNLIEEARELCDRVAVLRAGRLVAIDAPSRLGMRDGRNRRYRIVVDRVTDALVARARSVPGLVSIATSERDGPATLEVEIEPVRFSLTALLRAVSANGVDVREIAPESATSGELFALLTADDR